MTSAAATAPMAGPAGAANFTSRCSLWIRRTMPPMMQIYEELRNGAR